MLQKREQAPNCGTNEGEGKKYSCYIFDHKEAGINYFIEESIATLFLHMKS
jgi:hypothetical protein